MLGGNGFTQSLRLALAHTRHYGGARNFMFEYAFLSNPDGVLLEPSGGATRSASGPRSRLWSSLSCCLRGMFAQNPNRESEEEARTQQIGHLYTDGCPRNTQVPRDIAIRPAPRN